MRGFAGLHVPTQLSVIPPAACSCTSPSEPEPGPILMLIAIEPVPGLFVPALRKSCDWPAPVSAVVILVL